LSLIEMIVASFVGTSGFLIRNYNSHTKQTQRHWEKSRVYF